LTNDNNDTKMSNNEAFLAFLSKNDGTDDEWWNIYLFVVLVR
jgi:hypothetical protein